MCTKIFKQILLQSKKWQQLQNQQKDILQQKDVVAGKNLPYDLKQGVVCPHPSTIIEK